MGILYQAEDPLYWAIWLFILFALMAFNELGRVKLWAGIALFEMCIRDRYDAQVLPPPVLQSVDEAVAWANELVTTIANA